MRLFIILFCISLQLFSQNYNYQKEWEKVHNFELESLPKSALEVVDAIYSQAKKDENNIQITKALIYQSKFALTLEENAQLSIINNFKEHIDNSNSPEMNLLESMLAELYWQYYRANKWKILERTETEKKVDSIDFRAWDAKTLYKEISKHYVNSLNNPEVLQKTGLTQYNQLLDVKLYSKKYRPTLYDFLAARAIDYFENEDYSMPRPSFAFKMNEEKLMGDNATFLEYELTSKDSLSEHLKALKIFKEWTAFQLKNPNSTPLIDLTLKRLQFVYQNTNLENKDDLYINALLTLRQKYMEVENSTEIDFTIASFYVNQANENDYQKNPEHHNKRVEALKFCNEAINRFLKSLGALQCKELKFQIIKPTLEITTEQMIPTMTPSRVLVEFKNLDTLHFSILEVNDRELKEFSTIFNDSKRVAFINTLKRYKHWTSNLSDPKDYNPHTTEVKIPEVPQGRYLVVASVKDTISEEEMLAFQSFQATDFVIIKENQGYENRFQIVDRVTGKPISGASVSITNTDTGQYNRPINKNLVTNEHGYISFTTTQYHRNVVIRVRKNGKQGVFDNFYFYENRSDTEVDDQPITIKPFIFTDRSIYRPGQTVFFKAILLKQKGEKSEPLTNEYVEILLEDPNGQEVKQLDLKLNEFGSVAGEFILPSSGLTGEYTILIDESYEYDSDFYDNADYDFEYYPEFTIAVEEYKRPKFEVEFKPITETFRLEDTITVKGNAIAFAGSNVSNGKVSYRVVRTAQFPIWRWGYTPSHYAPEMEITHGETTTKDDGSFEIGFTAIPDLDIPKTDQPTFNYKVLVDVTDINGETRSAEVNVKVGYHAMTLSLNAPQLVDKQNNQFEIKISAENLNGQNIDAEGILRIFKLKAPNNLLRPRPWPVPEIPGFTEKEFRQLFPHDAYTEEETNKTLWPKGEQVFQTTFNTANDSILIVKGLKEWVDRSYIIEIEANDKFGQLVKAEQQLTITDSKSKQVADSQLLIVETDKPSYKVGDDVIVTLSSASEEIWVTVQVEKAQEIVETKLIKLSNDSESFKIPIKKIDNEGFAVFYHYVNYNSFGNGLKMINVINLTPEFSIETLTFRDKIQPGSKESWSFKIKGEKNEKVAAEVLASMYDASLDDFKSHFWQFNPIQTSTYNTWVKSDASQSFGTVNFQVINKPFVSGILTRKYYDQLNWFGLSLLNQDYQNRRYLREIRDLPTGERENYDKIIYGVIKDEDGLPLPGVNIVIKGTTFGTQTDFDGEFQLKVNNSDVVVVSYIGMMSQEIKINAQKKIEITLEEDSAALEEVVVVGYGTSKESKALGYSVTNMVTEQVESDESVSQVLAGQVAGVQVAADSMIPGSAPKVMIRGAASLQGQENALYVIDGVIVENFDINGDDIASMNVLKGESATALYGAAAANGVIIITTKSGQAKLDAELAQIQTRQNFNETAFFYPQLRTDKDGNISFEFTMPEALTRWKMQLLAHTKDLRTSVKTLSTVTQKDLMVLPNVPRFLREGDRLVLSTKISNLSSSNLSGNAQLLLEDAITGKSLDQLMGNVTKSKAFILDAKGNTNVQWTIEIPENIQAVTYKIVAKAGDFTDGEQAILPVLSNRTLVTETLPMWVRSGETKTFTLDKLKNNTSTTLTNHNLTLEVTSNPVWYAIQSLPYLMEYPFECAEQIFSRYYANSLGQTIANSNPKIKQVFDMWNSSDALISNLEKNENLKSIIIQETPWLRAAQSETEQKKRIALLFDLNKMGNELNNALVKLEQMQLNNGGFPWFKGSGYPSRYITQHIAIGLGHLHHLKIESPEKANNILSKSVSFLDTEIIKDYNILLEEARRIREKAKTKSEGLKAEKEYLEANHTGNMQIHYLYMRSFFTDNQISESLKPAFEYYKHQTATYWKDYNLYTKGLITLIQHRIGDKTVATAITRSLKENSITSEELGMYWKENKAGWYWYQAPIETQARMIEVFSEVTQDNDAVDELRVWLLKNKQTNHWKTTKATTEAIYAMLLNGTDWVESSELVGVQLGDKNINPFEEETQVEAGTGYFKISYGRGEIEPEMATVTLTKPDDGIAWGALYWQYFEDLDKITSAETPLSLRKKLFKKTNSDTGEVLTEIDSDIQLKVGDLIRVRIELRSDRDMEFIHMKDMRASGLEPINVLSEYKWQDGLGYYESTKDASTNFFFERLPKGVYVFEYDLRVSNAGNFSNGIANIECMYAPEFQSHSDGTRISVDPND